MVYRVPTRQSLTTNPRDQKRKIHWGLLLSSKRLDLILPLFKLNHREARHGYAHDKKQVDTYRDTSCLPDRLELLGLLPRDRVLAPSAFEIKGQHFNESGDVLFAAARHPDLSGKIVALLHPFSVEAADQAILKIPHYGRYSYLAFSYGRIRLKARGESMIHRSWFAGNPE